MTKSTKAVLFATLVLPGAGHFYLKKYIPGMVLAATSLVSLYYIIAKMVQRASVIAEQILKGQVQPDMATIMELVSRHPVGSEAGLLNVAWAVLILSWLIGIADAYRVGRIISKFEAS